MTARKAKQQQLQKQVPFGDDRKKSKCDGKGVSARLNSFTIEG
jgi:hypothetical protein